MTRVNQHDACVATLEFFNRIDPERSFLACSSDGQVRSSAGRH
jgi:hypothetical protein